MNNTNNNKYNFNIDHLVDDITMVIQNGLKEYLNKYMERYELLEATHEQLMKLPSILNKLKQQNNMTNETSNHNNDICINNENEKGLHNNDGC